MTAPDAPAGGWAVAVVPGAAALHRRDPGPVPRRALWVGGGDDHPVLVLGSTQPDADVDAAAVADRGAEVVRRRSGGGAVLLEPGGAAWIDVVLPVGDPCWEDDVGRAAHWVGAAWTTALADLGLDGAEVHRGAMVRTAWSATACFAGLGPGEVTWRGRKVVGISQRRTRHGARFQTVALCGAAHPAGVADLLALGPAERASLGAALDAGVAVVPAAADVVAEAVLAAVRAVSR